MNLLNSSFYFLQKKFNAFFYKTPQKDPTQLYLEKEVDTLIELKDYTTIAKMIQSGYPATERQASIVNNFICELFTNDNLKKNNSLILELVPEFKSQHIFQCLSNSSFMIYCFNHLESFTYEKVKQLYPSNPLPPLKPESKLSKMRPLTDFQEILPQIMRQLEKPEIQIELWQDFKNSITPQKFKKPFFYLSDYNLNQMFSVMRHFWVNTIPINEFIELYKKIKQTPTENENLFIHHSSLYQLKKEKFFIAFEELFYDTILKLRENHNINLINSVKTVYFKDNINQKTKEVQNSKKKEESEQFTSSLPMNAQRILNDIQQNLIRIIQSKNDSETNFLITNISEKVLPNTINKYLSIHDEYKETLTNSQGKNSTTLLVESLYDINLMLEKKLIEINESKITDLSSNQKYISSLTKTMFASK